MYITYRGTVEASVCLAMLAITIIMSKSLGGGCCVCIHVHIPYSGTIWGSITFGKSGKLKIFGKFNFGDSLTSRLGLCSCNTYVN